MSAETLADSARAILLKMPGQDLTASRKRSKRQGSRRNDDSPAEYSGYLPLDIVEIILTYLPINLAVQSALVGKRFKDVWMFSRRLEFGRDLAIRFSTFDYFTIVNTIICLHQGPKIQSFSMYLDPTGYEAQVRHWIEIVMSKGVEELDLDFVGTWNHRKFPLGPLELPLVRVLKLSLCDFPLHQSPDSLRCLRTLVLKNVNINMKIIETVLKNCKLLETLEIIYCRIVGPIRIVANDLKRFLTLKISDCPDICHLEIDSPTLRSLHFSGRVPLLIFGDMSQLYDTILNVKPHPGLLISSHLIRRLIRDFSHIRVLTLNGAFLEGLTSTYFDLLRGKKTVNSFTKLVELQIFVDGSLICNPYDIISFIVRCPKLERLFIDLKESSLEGSIVFEVHQKHELKKFTKEITGLRFVHMKNFTFQRCELELVKFLLRRAVNLELMVLTTPKYARREVSASGHKIYDKLVNCKASPKAEIHILQTCSEQCQIEPMHERLWW